MPPAARPLLLLCLTSVLGIVAVHTFVPSEWSAPMPHPPSPVVLAQQGLDLADGPEQLVHMLERPLFVEGRRPHPAASAAPEPEDGPNTFSSVDLIGLFGSGPNAGIIIRHDSKAYRVAVGMPFHGWLLRSVDPTTLRAVFVSEDGQGSHALQLKHLPQQGDALATLKAAAPVPRPQRLPGSAPIANPTNRAQGQDSGATLPRGLQRQPLLPPDRRLRE